MFVRRPGGQSQFAAPVWTEATAHDGIRTALRLVHADPGADLDVATLAAAASMSPRHFSRLFTAEIGASPGRHVERVRLDHARRLLETTDLTLDEIARRSGFGTAETLRRVFARRLGTPPGAYRARFTPTPTRPSWRTQ